MGPRPRVEALASHPESYLERDAFSQIPGSVIQSRLTAALVAAPKAQAAVAVSRAGERSYASADIPAGRRTAQRLFTVETGCATKILTAQLVLDAVERGVFSLEDTAFHILGHQANHALLDGVTVRHLLEHTHGFDDSAIDHPVTNGVERIDVDSLLARASGFRRRPGELYSYSNIGPWLAAAILEHSFDTTYEDALSSQLLKPLGIELCKSGNRASLGPSAVCASRGGTLALTLHDMLRVLEYTCARARTWAPADCATQDITPLPGWSVAERGIRFGMKYFGDGWYGHNSVLPGASLLVRFHPLSLIALVVASRDHPASFLAAKVFGRELPELRNLSVPKPLSSDEAATLDMGSFRGCYASANRQLSITSSGSELVLSSSDALTRLVPGPNALFFARPPNPTLPAYVQFLRRDGCGFRYLWDGKHIFEKDHT